MEGETKIFIPLILTAPFQPDFPVFILTFPAFTHALPAQFMTPVQRYTYLRQQ